MPDEGSQFDDTEVPPPLDVQQQQEEEEQRRQQQQTPQDQARQMVGQEVKKALLARARQWAAKIAAQVGTWITSVALPAIGGFIVAFWPYILAVIVIIGLVAAIFGYVFKGLSGSIPGATISLQDPSQAQLVNQLLALTGNQTAIAKLIRENSVEMKKAVDEMITDNEKIKTPEAEKMRLEFKELRKQIDQLLLAGSNTEQAKNVVQNIGATVTNIKKILDNGRQLLAQEILSDAYKNKIKLSGINAGKDVEAISKGQLPTRQDGALQAMDIRILKTMKYLADQGIVFTPTVIIAGHNKNVAGTSRVSFHWYGGGLDIRASVQDQAAAGSFADKIVQAMINAPADIKPTEIVGNIKNKYGKPYKFDEGHEDHIHIGYRQ